MVYGNSIEGFYRTGKARRDGKAKGEMENPLFSYTFCLTDGREWNILNLLV